MPVAPSKARESGTSWVKSCSERSSVCPAVRAVDVPAPAAGKLSAKQLLMESGSALSHGLSFPPAHSKSENSQEATGLILGTGWFSMEKASAKMSNCICITCLRVARSHSPVLAPLLSLQCKFSVLNRHSRCGQRGLLGSDRDAVRFPTK